MMEHNYRGPTVQHNSGTVRTTGLRYDHSKQVLFRRAYGTQEKAWRGQKSISSCGRGMLVKMHTSISWPTQAKEA
jgi:hypothetical protein